MNYVEQSQIAVKLRPVPQEAINRVLAAIDRVVLGQSSNKASAIERICWPGGTFGPLSPSDKKAINTGAPMLLPLLENPQVIIMVVND